jgi:hypothetical protein
MGRYVGLTGDLYPCFGTTAKAVLTLSFDSLRYDFMRFSLTVQRPTA